MELLLAFVAASAVMIAIPGPNVALIVASSISYGVRYGLVTVVGVTAGAAIQLYLTVFGLAALVAAVADLLTWIRWAGVAYLIYLGIRAWTQPVDNLGAVPNQPKSIRGLFWRGVVLAMANPKTLLFYVAFLPQFVRPDGDVALQLFVLSAIYIAVSLVGDTCWAMLAGAARRFLVGYGRLRNRITGSLFVGAGIGLALSRS